jgi:uncharacterized protein with PIN domain
MSTCPKCDRSITQLNAVSTLVKTGNTEINGVIYTCPGCGVALGAGVDPQAMVNATIDGVTAELRKG